MTTPSIVEFLHARIEEDFEAAFNASQDGDAGNTWTVGARDARKARMGDDREDLVFDIQNGVCIGFDELLTFLTRNDPARVLREVEAKRRIMERHKPDDRIIVKGPYRGRYSCDGCNYEYGTIDEATQDINECPELRDLAAVYSDSPDYREEWRS
jgi:hypothetical protein